jgi:hypothetical protein
MSIERQPDGVRRVTCDHCHMNQEFFADALIGDDPQDLQWQMSKAGWNWVRNELEFRTEHYCSLCWGRKSEWLR